MQANLIRLVVTTVVGRWGDGTQRTMRKLWGVVNKCIILIVEMVSLVYLLKLIKLCTLKM